MKNLHLTLVPLGIVLMVAGCGGGGSSSSSNSGAIPTAAVKITSSTAATQVAKGANSSTQNMNSTGSSMGSMPTTVGVVATQNHHSQSVLDISLGLMNLAHSVKLPAPSVAGVITSVSVSCGDFTTIVTPTTPNSFTLSYVDPNNNDIFDAGDSMVMAFKTCVMGPNTSNGSVTFAIISMTTLPVASRSTLTYSSFSSANSSTGENLSMNGDMTVDYSESGGLVSSAMTGTSFAMTSSIDGDFLMQNYNLSYSSDASYNYSYTSSMYVASTSMGGSITITNNAPFTGNANVAGGNPTAGSMTITGGPATTGGANTYVTLVANADGLHADLTIFDGTNTTTTQVLWADL